MASETLVLAIFLFTFLTGIPSNLLAFYTFLVKVRRKPTPIDILLLNLTISDILLLLVLPVKMVEASSHMTWLLPPSLCPLTNCCFYGSMYLSTIFLTSISVDRYLSVVYPIRYKLHRRPAYALLASITFWFLGGFHCGIVYIFRYGGSNESLPYSPNSSLCFENFSPEQLRVILSLRLEVCLIFFCLPFLITLFCYINIIRILNSLPNIQAGKKQRAVGLALATLLLFTICFSPYNLSHMVGFSQNQSPPWRVEGFLLSALNTSVDPLIFFFSSKVIRQTLSDFWGSMHQRIQAVIPSFKHPADDDERAGTGQFSSSHLQSGHQGADAQTETFLDQPGKTCSIRVEGIPW